MTMSYKYEEITIYNIKLQGNRNGGGGGGS